MNVTKRLKKMKKGSLRTGLAGMSVILLLSAVAVAMPHWAMAYAEHRTLGQREPFSFSLADYQNLFADFGEELDAMAQADAWEDIYLMNVMADGDVDQFTLQQMTDAVNRELGQMARQGILEYPITVEAGNLADSALFSLYSPQEDNPLNGIMLWGLTYEDISRNLVLNVVLEGNFLKICEFAMTMTVEHADGTQEGVPLVRSQSVFLESLASYYQMTEAMISLEPFWENNGDGIGTSAASVRESHVYVADEASGSRSKSKDQPPKKTLMLAYDRVSEAYDQYDRVSEAHDQKEIYHVAFAIRQIYEILR